MTAAVAVALAPGRLVVVARVWREDACRRLVYVPPEHAAGTELRALRQRCGLSLARAALALGLTPQQLGDVEFGALAFAEEGEYAAATATLRQLAVAGVTASRARSAQRAAAHAAAVAAPRDGHGPYCAPQSPRTPPARRGECRRYNRCLDVCLERGWPGFVCGDCTDYVAPTPEESLVDCAGLLAIHAEITGGRP